MKRTSPPSQIAAPLPEHPEPARRRGSRRHRRRIVIWKFPQRGELPLNWKVRSAEAVVLAVAGFEVGDQGRALLRPRGEAGAGRVGRVPLEVGLGGEERVEGLEVAARCRRSAKETSAARTPGVQSRRLARRRRAPASMGQ